MVIASLTRKGNPRTEALIQRDPTSNYPALCVSKRIRPCSVDSSSRSINPVVTNGSAPFPNADSFSAEQTGTVATRTEWTDGLEGDPEANAYVADGSFAPDRYARDARRMSASLRKRPKYRIAAK